MSLNGAPGKVEMNLSVQSMMSELKRVNASIASLEKSIFSPAAGIKKPSEVEKLRTLQARKTLLETNIKAKGGTI